MTQVMILAAIFQEGIMNNEYAYKKTKMMQKLLKFL